MKKPSLSPAAIRPAPDAALVAMPRPAETLDRAGRANFFHRLSREAGAVAIRAALAAGVELLEARREMAGGFLRWIEAKCDFSQRTAYNYIRLAEATLPEAAVPALLEGSDEERTRAVEEAAASADSRTLTDLYADLGIVRRTPSRMGGARPGAGRPPKAEEAARLAREAAAIAADPEIADAAMGALLEPLRVWAEEKDGLVAVTDKALGLLVATLRDIAKIAGQIQAERKALRRAAR